MFFKKQKCDSCDTYYESTNLTCPICGAPNKHPKINKISRKISWISWSEQLGVLALGTVGLIVVTLFIQIFGLTLGWPQFETESIGALGGYGILFVLMFVYSIFRKADIFKSFKKISTYIFGILFGIAIWGVTVAYSSLINVIHPIAENLNEQSVESIVAWQPGLSILIFAFLGPYVEEMTYRVGLFGLTSRINKLFGYIISVFIFAMIHFSFNNDLVTELLNLPIYLWGGFMLCLIYDKFGLAGSYTAHATNNLISVVITIISINL